jgi:hypothetical protein
VIGLPQSRRIGQNAVRWLSRISPPDLRISPVATDLALFADPRSFAGITEATGLSQPIPDSTAAKRRRNSAQGERSGTLG